MELQTMEPANPLLQTQQQADPDLKTNLPIPSYAADKPKEFVDFLSSVDLEQSERVDLKDGFFEEINDYLDGYYEDIYANQEEPPAVVSDMLSFLEDCVGGNYLFGGQGGVVTEEFVLEVTQMYPDYMDSGRKEYYLEVARRANAEDPTHIPVYPDDYAWDCSGLWWDCCNDMSLYPEYTDRTANQTFEDFCIPIRKEDLQPGDLVFYRNTEGMITHMGIMGEKGYIYEASGGFIGVVKQRSLDARIYKDIIRGAYIVSPHWNEFGRPIIFQ